MPIRQSHRGLSTSAHKETAESRYGNFILKKNAPAQIWSPSYNGTLNTCRILPAKDPEDQQKFLPTKIDDGSDEPVFSDWIRRYPIVKFFGNPSFEMALADSSVELAELKLTNPCWILVRAIERAIERGQEKSGWGRLVKGKQRVLPAPTQAFFCQTFLFKHKSKNFYCLGGAGKKAEPPKGSRNDDHVVLMNLPKTAGQALLRCMEDGKENFERDPVDLNGGAFVHIFERGTDPLGRASGHVENTDVYAGGDGDGGGDSQFKGYDVALTQNLDDNPRLLPMLVNKVELVRQKVKPFDELIAVHSADEQLAIICKSFMLCADQGLKDTLIDVLRYAFADQQHRLSDAVRDYGKKSASVPSAPPGARRPATPAPEPEVHPADQEMNDFFGGGDSDEVAPDVEAPQEAPQEAEAPMTAHSDAPLLDTGATASAPVVPPAGTTFGGSTAPPDRASKAQEAMRAAAARALARKAAPAA